jgi:ABC-type transport system involved in multi-copper enzyme maturation permease subunit
MLTFSARKLLQNRRWLIVALLTALVAAVMGYSATQDGADMDGMSDLMGLLLIAFLLPVLALIYGASMIRNEIDDRSIVQVITAPLDRRIAYLGYYLALVVVLTVLIAVATIVGGLSYLLFIPDSSGAIEVMAVLIAVQIIGVMIYSALFLMMGAILKQPVYLGLFYVFVWEGYVASVPGAIGSYTIRNQLRVIASESINYGNIAHVTGDGTISLIVLIVLAVVLITLGAFLFRDMEVA